ncbi:NPP1 family protein [Streptomyces sp. NPDC050704]|uniref:NPP1 family protein n=1 Tax=Streptomyces sp. NPDC050704 TaxID=3157219 RepID=UPI00341AEF31
MFKAVQNRKKSRLGKASLVAVSATALIVGLAGSASADNLNPLREKASTFQLKYRPYFDYDEDGCYPAAAVDSTGFRNRGLNPTGTLGGGCKSNHLGRANTYAQSVCKNGWCAYVYALYFEKDQSGAASGHRHDWESVVVFQKQGEERPRYLAASRHGNYSTHPINEVPMDGNHVKIVYHKDGGAAWDTHAFRFAKWGETPEAYDDGGWDRPALVTMETMDKAPRDQMWNSNKKDSNYWGSANFPLTNNLYSNINGARPSAVPAF